MANGSLTHCILCVVLVAAQFCRERWRNLENLLIEERNTKFKRVSHTHSVGFKKDVADHPHIDVEILHFCNIVILTATIIIFSCKILWACCNWRIFQKLLLLLVVIHKCVTDITLLKLVTGTDEIISALDVGELSADCSYCLSDAMRNNCLINFKHSRIVVASVTAEQFVCTLTRKDNLYIMACKTGYKVKCDTWRICKRLIHMVLNSRNSVPEFFAWDKVSVVFNTDFFTEIFCPADFVIFFAKVKADCKCFLVGKICWNIAWVNTAWKETTNLNIGNFVSVYGVFKNLFNSVNSLFLRHFFVGIETSLKVTGSFNLAVLVPEIVTGHKAVDTLKESFGRNCILEWKVGIKCLSVEFLFKLRIFKNTLDFTCIDKVIAYLSVVHRLNSEKVTGNKKWAILCVVNSKAEHTTEFWEHIFFPLFKAVNKHFTVCICIELMTFCDKFFSQILVVINFTVECENKAFILIVYRLMTCTEINNGKSAKSHGNIVVRKKSVRVGTTVSDNLCHISDNIGSVFNLSHKAGYAAHITIPLSR